jgi:hypothetical protein
MNRRNFFARCLAGACIGAAARYFPAALDEPEWVEYPGVPVEAVGLKDAADATWTSSSHRIFFVSENRIWWEAPPAMAEGDHVVSWDPSGAFRLKPVNAAGRGG